MHCHPSVFKDDYDSVRAENSTQVKVDKFIKDCCGAISIEETNETEEKGKYIVIVPEDKLESARTAIGKMFQEFQTNGGRPAALDCLAKYQNYPSVNDNVTISGHAQRLSERIRDRYRNKPKTHYNNQSSPSYSYHGSIAANEQNLAQPTTAAVPRSIIRKGKTQSNNIQQWPHLPIVQQQQQQQQRTPTHQVEDRTVMSNLSPDDSAKTMMTNVSKMVESLGTVVTTMAKETANTNETMKQMMIQQATTMNNLMMMMSRNEERRQEVPIREIQPTRDIHLNSTPTSTLTNSQFSQSQQSTKGNKRTKYGITDDETTAATTVENATTDEIEEGKDDNMEEDLMGETNKDDCSVDEIMEDNAKTIDGQTNTTMAAGDFSQFETQPKQNNNNNNNNTETNQTNTSAKTDMNSTNE